MITQLTLCSQSMLLIITILTGYEILSQTNSYFKFVHHLHKSYVVVIVT